MTNIATTTGIGNNESPSDINNSQSEELRLITKF